MQLCLTTAREVLGQTVEPLPFRKMTRYPFGPDETYPNTPFHHEYLRKYQTRTQDFGRFWRQIHCFRSEHVDDTDDLRRR